MSEEQAIRVWRLVRKFGLPSAILAKKKHAPSDPEEFMVEAPAEGITGKQAHELHSLAESEDVDMMIGSNGREPIVRLKGRE